MQVGRRESGADVPTLVPSAPPTAGLEIHLLGAFDVRVAGNAVDVTSRAAQTLVAYLALNPGVRHRREHLAALLWPDSNETNSRNNLRGALWRARKAIEGEHGGARGRLEASEFFISLRIADGDRIDVAAFDGSPALETSDALIAAASAYGGELLPGFYDEWVVLERQRLQAALEARMTVLLDHLAAEGRWDEVRLWGERWIALGQTPEPAFRALMLAHAAGSDRSRVAATYRRCVAALDADLGVAPSDETSRLFDWLIGGGDPSRSAAPTAHAASPDRAVVDAAPAPGDPPFMGLLSFDESDADRFFGRGGLTSQLVDRIGEATFLAVVGASGSGKSSIVRAGMMPRLRGIAGTRIRLMTPTAMPLEALAASLLDRSIGAATVLKLADDLANDRVRRLDQAGGGKGPLTLVVDQFEELFTVCRDADARQAFVRLLIGGLGDASPPTVRVVIVLRADFYAECANDVLLREALAASQVFIGRMSTAELRQAIELPAARGGWSFEPGVVDLILRDVGDEPGGLPLLSHALLETWHRRQGRTMTLRGYAESGGVRGAIARSAERLFNHRFAAREQAAARGILLRLTELGPGAQATRRRASIRELVAPGAGGAVARAVLDALVEARLVTANGDSVEVAHEALITEWPTLGRWLAEDREGLRIHRHLTEAAQAWDGFDRDRDQVYRGARLAQAAEWALDHDPDMNPLERDFLAASRDQALHERSEEEARRQRELEQAHRLLQAERERAEAAATQVRSERTSARRLRRRAVYLGVALVLAIVLAVRAGFLETDARRSAALANDNAIAAETANRVAQSRELAAAATVNLDLDPERSILLALQAVGIDPTLEAEEALHASVGASRVTLTLAGDGAVIDAAFSPDGKRIVTAADPGAAVWDATSGKLDFPLVGHDGEVNSATFGPDGSLIATAGDDGTVRIWDASTGRLVRVLAGHTDNVARVVFNPDGSMLASAGLDGTARIWAVATGRQIRLIPTGNALRGIAWSPDGARLATASLDGTIGIWDPATGGHVRTLIDGPHAVYGVAWSPDSKQLASASADSYASIWDASTGARLRTLLGHTSVVQGIRYSPDGRSIATSSYDNTAKIWDAASGAMELSLAGHAGLVYGVSFSPDGDRLVTASDDHTVRVWTLRPTGERPTLDAGKGPALAVAFSPTDSSVIASVGGAGSVTLWDAPAGSMRALVGHIGDVYSVTFSPDGTELATAGADRTARIWDVASGRQLVLLSGHAAPDEPAFFPGVLDAVFSPDGRRVATAGDDGTARIWDATSGHQLLKLVGHDGPVGGAAFSPDGARLATSGWDGTAIVWDSTTGERLFTLTGHTWIVRQVVFSPDGSKIATASFDGTAKIWDAHTGGLLSTLTGHTALLFGVAFSPDGSRIATASNDTTVKLWDADTGRELFTLLGHTSSVDGLAFSPDGRTLATASEDGTVRQYLMHLDDLVLQARTLVTRTLDTPECLRYLHLAPCPQPTPQG